MRLFTLLALVLCVCALGMGSKCNDDSGRLEMVHEPRFTSFSYNFPPARSDYFSGPPFGLPEPDQTSGFDYLMRFIPEKEQANHVVVQKFVVTGFLWHSRNDCGDFHVRIARSGIEYFSSPANDVQCMFSKSAPEFSGHVEGRYSETRVGIVSYMELPGIPPAIDPGQNVAFLRGTFFAGLTPHQRQQFRHQLINDPFLQWEHQKQYDGCKPPDGINHILNHTWWRVINGTPQRRQHSQFSGSGGQW